MGSLWMKLAGSTSWWMQMQSMNRKESSPIPILRLEDWSIQLKVFQCQGGFRELSFPFMQEPTEKQPLLCNQCLLRYPQGASKTRGKILKVSLLYWWVAPATRGTVAPWSEARNTNMIWNTKPLSYWKFNASNEEVCRFCSGSAESVLTAAWLRSPAIRTCAQ